MKIPVIELSDCILCEICVEYCPEVFRMNDAGYVEVLDLSDYPQEIVDHTIKNWPTDYISWGNG